jgi:hypothetical protein
MALQITLSCVLLMPREAPSLSPRPVLKTCPPRTCYEVAPEATVVCDAERLLPATTALEAGRPVDTNQRERDGRPTQRSIEGKLLARHTESRWGCDTYTATVTRRKVAGMEVASSLGFAFWALKRVSNSACRSSSRPLAAAASKAFMVGP